MKSDFTLVRTPEQLEDLCINLKIRLSYLSFCILGLHNFNAAKSSLNAMPPDILHRTHVAFGGKN